MTIIETIRAEIVRLMDEYKPIVGGVDELTGAHIVLAKLISSLSTLESEKPINQSARQRLAEWSKTPEGRESYEKVAEEMRREISEKPMNQDGLEEEINRYLEPIHAADIQFEPFTQMTKCARHFAQWQKEQMMKEAVEIGTTEICWVPDGDRVFPTFDPPVEDLLMPGIISQRFKDGDKVRIIVIPNTDEK